MSTVASPLAVAGSRQSGAPVRTQNGTLCNLFYKIFKLPFFSILYFDITISNNHFYFTTMFLFVCLNLIDHFPLTNSHFENGFQ